MHRIAIFKLWSENPLGYPKYIQGVYEGFPFPTTHEGRSSSYVSSKTTFCNSLKANTVMRIQLSFIKPNVKEICKNVNQCHSLIIFLESFFFHKNMLTCNRFSVILGKSIDIANNSQFQFLIWEI